MPSWLEKLLTRGIEYPLSAWPRRAPGAEQLAAARIVAHRGERDGVHVKENTIAAFDPVIAAGVDAIEFDIRYTRDDEPVVHHDADLARVFGRDITIADMSWRELHQLEPAIPHLNDMLARYSGRATLMIELKCRGTARAETRLHDALASLVPANDFYCLSLEPALFAACHADWPAATRIPVAKLNWPSLRAWAETHDCGGIAGPFMLMRRAEIATLVREHAFIGSGFLTQRGLLLREIARGVPWLFTNRPVAMQRMLDDARERAR